MEERTIQIIFLGLIILALAHRCDRPDEANVQCVCPGASSEIVIAPRDLSPPDNGVRYF